MRQENLRAVTQEKEMDQVPSKSTWTSSAGKEVGKDMDGDKNVKKKQKRFGKTPRCQVGVKNAGGKSLENKKGTRQGRKGGESITVLTSTGGTEEEKKKLWAHSFIEPGMKTVQKDQKKCLPLTARFRPDDRGRPDNEGR